VRLRNRISKATYWVSGDLLRWHRDKREFYRSLWACAEDSCCIEDDMFEVKMTAWPSPMDVDMTVERFEAWRDELIEADKLVPYYVAGRRYFFIPPMADHERPRNPQAPDIPVPQWVTFTVSGTGQARRCTYVFGDCTHALRASSGDSTVTVQSDSGNREATVQSGCGNRKATPALPCTALPCSALPSPDINPALLGSSRVQGSGRGSYPQEADEPGPAIAYWEGKLDRPLTPDELRSVKRWVRVYGSASTTVQIGYAAEDGVASDTTRIGGALKRASKARADGAGS
jgi:hypothetical protein